MSKDEEFRWLAELMSSGAGDGEAEGDQGALNEMKSQEG